MMTSHVVTMNTVTKIDNLIGQLENVIPNEYKLYLKRIDLST